MSPLWRKLFCLAGAVFCSFSLLAQPVANAGSPTPVKSPVALFRELLAMTPQQRKEALAIRPPEIQKRILQKLGEYEILPGELREQRLRETELRWYLRPLMDLPRTNRAARLALIPEEERELVKERLAIWDLVPPPLQQRWKDDDVVANYLARVGSQPDEPPPRVTPEESAALKRELEQWNKMTPQQRQRALAGFERIFRLPPEERDRTLDTASDEERQQMEQTLGAYGKLTPEQRARCIRSFEKFAAMSLEQREQFLKNADEWNKMTPEERQKWRELVTVAPIVPPSPEPPSPTSSIRAAEPAVATN